MDKLREELTDWVARCKDAAECNALAEDPNESADYLVNLIVDKLTVIKPSENAPWSTACIRAAIAQLQHTIKEIKK